MPRRIALFALLLAMAAGLGGCAVSDGGPGGGGTAYAPPPQPAARVGLPGPLKVFYDQLAPYGDWVLVGPYGWVFHPDVNSVAWRPYQDGQWVPSDVFGWVWESNEPFGWITYHYGNWFYDSFQGWVWKPDAWWGPSWVAWVQAGSYVGWAPLPPGDGDLSSAPGGAFTYLPGAMLGDQMLGQQATYVNAIGANVEQAEPVVRLGSANGVTFNRGPDPAALARLRGAVVSPSAGTPSVRRLELHPATPAPGAENLLSRTNRLAAEANRELRAVRAGHGPTPPMGEPGLRLLPGGGHGAGADSARVAPARGDSTASRPDSTAHGQRRGARRPAPGSGSYGGRERD